MAASSTPDSVFIFDGDCGFCTTASRVLRRVFDPLKHFEVEPYQRLNLSAYGLTSAQCAAAAQFVRKDGSVHSGHRAIAQALLDGRPLAIPFGAVLSLPVIDQVAEVVYQWIADNRSMLPGGTPACALTETPESSS